GLSYAAVLALVHTWTVNPGPISTSRRTAFGLVAATLVSYAGTYLAVLFLPQKVFVPAVVLEDPQEPVPSGGLDTPNPHPNSVQPVVAAAPTSTPDAVGDVAPERELTRDKDGAVVPSGRVPGQLAPPITRNDDFYVVTKNAAGDPLLRTSDWRLLVD